MSMLDLNRIMEIISTSCLPCLVAYMQLFYASFSLVQELKHCRNRELIGKLEAITFVKSESFCVFPC